MAERNERRDHHSGGGPHLHRKRRKRNCRAVIKRPKLRRYQYRCRKFVFWPAVAVLGMLHVVPPKLDARQRQTSDAAAQDSQPPGNFVDITDHSGVHFKHQASHTSKKYLPETMGAGVAMFDYDNDGRLDIFLVNGAPLSDPTPQGTIPQKTDAKYWNRLYHQKPDGTFEDVMEKAGLQGTGYGMGGGVGGSSQGSDGNM